MLLKDLRKTIAFKNANIVKLCDKAGDEIEIKSETQRRDLNNKTVIDQDTIYDNGIMTLEVYLDV